MSPAPLLKWLTETAIGSAISVSSVLFPLVESIHVLAFTVVLGTIATVDLRLLGVAQTNRRVSEVTRTFLPITWTAFAIAAVTGTMLFSSNAVNYGANHYFRLKMILLVLAAINATVFHKLSARNLVNWDGASRTPWQAKVAGACSLLLWVAIVACGRWIGFTME